FDGGEPHADSDLLIDYDLARLPWCRQDYNGLPTWDVHANYRFDHGPITGISLTAQSPLEGRIAVPTRIHAPAGAQLLELWFENTDRTGCRAWDSDYGRNYRFEL